MKIKNKFKKKKKKKKEKKKHQIMRKGEKGEMAYPRVGRELVV